MTKILEKLSKSEKLAQIYQVNVRKANKKFFKNQHKNYKTKTHISFEKNPRREESWKIIKDGDLNASGIELICFFKRNRD